MNYFVYPAILFVTLVLFTGCSTYNSQDQKQLEPTSTGGAGSPPSVEKTGISAVRGVWLTNVDSDVLKSRENIKEAINLCSELGINTIFTVVWNKGFTLYPSKVMKDEFGIEIDTAISGRDPLKEVIEEAHKKKIKVIAWFEFGFASSFKIGGGHLLTAKPDWASKDFSGNLTTKNGFEWMNAFNPEVQNFILALISEVVRNYDVDGIQGDDRLPALPSNGGYDEYTVEQYKKEHSGNNPPEDYKNHEWVKWRADKLTEFCGKIHQTVKAINPNCIVSMSPSIYPWSKEEYLQDWPEWVKRGYVDLLCPQLYRYTIEEYKKVLSESYTKHLPKGYKHIFYPGVLIKVGGYFPKSDFLLQMIEANRELGIEGEVFFFYEGIKKYPDLFKNTIYRERADFPHLLK
jgi:uncharacterized lipoprotein YddW (UPF0748 family)